MISCAVQEIVSGLVTATGRGRSNESTSIGAVEMSQTRRCFCLRSAPRHGPRRGPPSPGCGGAGGRPAHRQRDGRRTRDLPADRQVTERGELLHLPVGAASICSASVTSPLASSSRPAPRCIIALEVNSSSSRARTVPRHHILTTKESRIKDSTRLGTVLIDRLKGIGINYAGEFRQVCKSGQSGTNRASRRPVGWFEE
jgi:hypothetical protein